jgi:hypothetical protein
VNQPHGHEVWDYITKGKTGVAKLIRVQIICRPCHQIHHWALTVKLFAQGHIDPDYLDELVDYFCRINSCKPKDFRRHAKEALAVFKKRSDLKWTVDCGPYGRDVERACAARDDLSGRRADLNKTCKQRIFDGDGPPPRSRKRKPIK